MSGSLYCYAVGRIVLWTNHASHRDVSKGLELLRDPAIKKIAIANPKQAPYGRAAVAAEVEKAANAVILIPQNDQIFVAQLCEEILAGQSDVFFAPENGHLAKSLDRHFSDGSSSPQG